jgi:hypothetical protein
VSETGDQFTGASERSTKHSPRVDDELEHEMQGRSTAESSDEADPDLDANTGGTLVGGTPAGMDADAVAARSELARWLDRADFPSSGPQLVAAARAHGAPDPVVAELSTLPDGEAYERVGDVVRALGYPTE